MQEKIYSHLLKTFPDLTGTLEIVAFGNDQETYAVQGNVHTSSTPAEVRRGIEAIVSEILPISLLSFDIKVNQGLTVLSTGKTITNEPPKRLLDTVATKYQGMLDTNLITQNNHFKQCNLDKIKAIDDCIKVLGVITPIVLDSSLKIIDGELRLALALSNGKKQVPVIVLDCIGNRADFLRLALNRSTEFQRWVYSDVDQFVDSIPQVQPLLEPLGFFGNKVLPESFFSETLINYSIDPFHAQQAAYKQDTTVAEWAKIRREEIKRLKEASRKPVCKPNLQGSVSLFDLAPTDEDFLPTYDAEEEIRAHTEQIKEVANTITINYDIKRKNEIESKGGVWQTSRKTSKMLAAEGRSELIAQIEAMNLSPEQHEAVLNNIEDIQTKEELTELLNNLAEGDNNG